MKHLTRSLAVALAAVFGFVAFSPPDADAHHRRHRRHLVVRPLHHHPLHVVVRGHGPVVFAYEDAFGRKVYRDRKGYFRFGPKGGHIHFVR